MSAATVSLFDGFISAIMGTQAEGTIGAIAQEIMILSVFALSFLIWRHFNRGARTKHRMPKVVESPCEAKDFDEPPSQPTYFEKEHVPGLAEKQLLKHLAGHQFTRALNMYRALERDERDHGFSEELYSNFIQSAIRVGKIDVVERMLKTMTRGKSPPSTKFWQTTLKMLSSRKHFAACVSIYTAFAGELPCDKVIFSCIINAALELGAADKANLMLPSYEKSGIDDKDYVLFFRTFVALGDADAAERMFRKLGNKVTPLMLNLLLLACVNSNRVERSLKLLEEAHELEKGRKGPSEAIVDVVSYNTVIKGFAAAKKPRRCFECLNMLMERGLEPDDITTGTLLDACIVDHDSQSASEMVKLLMGSSKPLDTVMCTVFMKGLVRAGCVSNALDIYDEMKQRSIATPDMVTYSVLIKALVDQHDLTRALALVDDMYSAGHRPDDIITTHLLEGCRYANNHALGKKIFQAMLNAGVKPSEYTLVTMLKLHGRCGALKEAYDLVAGWEGKHGGKPSVIHYTCLMSGCIRAKQFDQAWTAYELMKLHGVNPDETAVSTLLSGMTAAHMWDRVIAIGEIVLQNNKSWKMDEALNSALGQMLLQGSLRQKAEKLQEMMTASGVSIAAKNVRRLV